MDATRGAAMVAVVLSHSAQFLSAGQGILAANLTTAGLVATPTFLLLSGIVCSHLSTLERKSASDVRWRLIDRGLFLLLIAHLALGLTHAMWESAATALGHSFYITDAVAVGLIVAAFVTRRATRNQLLICGGGLLVAGWLISCSVAPRDGFAHYLMRMLVGSEESSDPDEGWIVPVMPYLGLFMIGMAGGIEYTARRLRGTSQRTIAHFCIVTGLACMTVALACKMGWLIMKPHVPGEWHSLLYRLTEPRQKIPPSPAYMLAFGGAGMLMAGLIVLLAGTPRGHRCVAALAVIGRASLFVFVMQYWLISVPALGFNIRGQETLWLTALAGSIGSLWLLARAWDDVNGNRILTLGLRRTSPVPRPTLGANENS